MQSQESHSPSESASSLVPVSSSTISAQTSNGKSITPSQLPYAVLKKAMEMRDEIDGFLLEVEMDHPEIPMTREQARSVIAFAVQEMEKDRLAPAPHSIDGLERKINRALNEEVDRIQTEMTALQKIVTLPEDGAYRAKNSQETFTPETARDRLINHTKRLLEIKKLLVEQRKADIAAKQGNVMNMQLNLGDVISDALSNMKRNAAPMASGNILPVIDASPMEIE